MFKRNSLIADGFSPEFLDVAEQIESAIKQGDDDLFLAQIERITTSTSLKFSFCKDARYLLEACVEYDRVEYLEHLTKIDLPLSYKSVDGVSLGHYAAFFGANKCFDKLLSHFGEALFEYKTDAGVLVSHIAFYSSSPHIRGLARGYLNSGQSEVDGENFDGPETDRHTLLVLKTLDKTCWGQSVEQEKFRDTLLMCLICLRTSPDTIKHVWVLGAGKASEVHAYFDAFPHLETLLINDTCWLGGTTFNVASLPQERYACVESHRGTMCDLDAKQKGVDIAVFRHPDRPENIPDYERFLDTLPEGCIVITTHQSRTFSGPWTTLMSRYLGFFNFENPHKVPLDQVPIHQKMTYERLSMWDGEARDRYVVIGKKRKF